MIPRKLRNFTCFVDGFGYVGRVSEVEPPKLAIKTEEHRAGGMDAPAMIDMGMEALEATLTFSEYSPELFKQFGLVDGEGVAMTLRGAMQGDGSDADSIIINLRGMFKELDSGSWKAGEDTTLKATIAARYYKYTSAGSELVEVDTVNMVRKIDGRDQLAAQRQALGL